MVCFLIVYVGSMILSAVPTGLFNRKCDTPSTKVLGYKSFGPYGTNGNGPPPSSWGPSMPTALIAMSCTIPFFRSDNQMRERELYRNGECGGFFGGGAPVKFSFGDERLGQQLKDRKNQP